MSAGMNTGWAVLAIVGLAGVTVFTRSFFLLSEREPVLPEWLKRGLRFAPLAALAAVVAPEVLLSEGQLIRTWQDARLYAVGAAVAYFVWRRGMLGTILVGMAVLVPLKLGLGW